MLQVSLFKKQAYRTIILYIQTDPFVGKTLLHGDVLMWLMKTLLTSGCTNQRGAGHQRELPSLRDGPRPENYISYSIHKEVHHKTGAGLPARCPSPPLKSAAAPGRRPGVVSLLMMGVVTTLLHRCRWSCGQLSGTRS
ncbi:hypothetical protein FT234_21200 [Escherichia coli]|nr:hypothetical protein [Escherichia coli]